MVIWSVVDFVFLPAGVGRDPLVALVVDLFPLAGVFLEGVKAITFFTDLPADFPADFLPLAAALEALFPEAPPLTLAAEAEPVFLEAAPPRVATLVVPSLKLHSSPLD